MEKTIVVQGKKITYKDIELVRQTINTNPSWNRTHLSKELCILWNWRATNGQLKDMACRSFLLKLEKHGYITLPLRQRSSGGNHRKVSVPYVSHKSTPIACDLGSLTPLRIELVRDKDLLGLFKCLLSIYHYLGFSGTVGENMKYMIFDKEDNLLSCLLFGSAAWKIAARDNFIGWNADTRKTNLNLLTNNMRFLILPWVKVPHLATHILGKVARRIRKDWIKRYSHPIYMLETFVEKERFRGICYQAANWIYVGQTKGYSRSDRHATPKVSIKDIYLLPLVKKFREALNS